MHSRSLVALIFIFGSLSAVAQTAHPWNIPYGPDVPGLMNAEALLPVPAGVDGFVTVRGEHFYSGEKRLRFWGTNFCFSACFPTHAQADAAAVRLARFGINAVRFHAMDSAIFPKGIFADETLETFSPEALDRLDYFIAALKRRGIYADLNLHVARLWTASHHWPADGKTPTFDKIIDLFHPDLIAAEKQYAHALLTHVNAYTGAAYKDEPAICFVEINNEDTFFTWGGEETLLKLPEPYATLLQKQWNAWLVSRYHDREQLRQAWAVGAEAMGTDLLTSHPWAVEQQGEAKLEEKRDATQHTVLDINQIDDVPWHARYDCPKISLRAGHFYTVEFRAKSDQPRTLQLTASQAHDPFTSAGLNRNLDLSTEWKTFRCGFICTINDDNVRLSYSVGQSTGAISLDGITLSPGGQQGLLASESPTENTVRRRNQGPPETFARADDWYRFLQHTEAQYYSQMHDYLRDEIGVKMPITGTIVMGMLGQTTQSKMDFVDGHRYWDHPHFPRKQWDPADWLIENGSMIDSPQRMIFRLAAERVRGKPYTVTEFNDVAPNDFQAEGIPTIAACAALQDWDGVFLFCTSHNDDLEKKQIDGFFNIEGNPLKMGAMPLASRLFLGGTVKPISNEKILTPTLDQIIRTAPSFYTDISGFAMQMLGATQDDFLHRRLSMDFGNSAAAAESSGRSLDERIVWKQRQFRFTDDTAAIFAGFNDGKPINVPLLTIEKLNSAFAVIMMVPADPKQTLRNADRILLFIANRAHNTDQKWNASRTSIGRDWGKPPVLIEPVAARVKLASERYHLVALKPDGKPDREVSTAGAFDIGDPATLWYQLDLRKPTEGSP